MNNHTKHFLHLKHIDIPTSSETVRGIGNNTTPHAVMTTMYSHEKDSAVVVTDDELDAPFYFPPTTNSDKSELFTIHTPACLGNTDTRVSMLKPHPNYASCDVEVFRYEPESATSIFIEESIKYLIGDFIDRGQENLTRHIKHTGVHPRTMSPYSKPTCYVCSSSGITPNIKSLDDFADYYNRKLTRRKMLDKNFVLGLLGSGKSALVYNTMMAYGFSGEILSDKKQLDLYSSNAFHHTPEYKDISLTIFKHKRFK